MRSLLIIEDEESLRSTLAERLIMEGFEVRTAEDGEQGVEVAREMIPDLIVCDIMMPQMDGHAVLRTLHGQPATAHIPFIFLTAKTDPAQIRAGMTLGADDYLCKPVSKSELLAAIEARLRKRDAENARIAGAVEAAQMDMARHLPDHLLQPLRGLVAASQSLESADPRLPVPGVQELGRVIRITAERLQQTVRDLMLFAELQIAHHDPDLQAALRGTQVVVAASHLSRIAREIALQESRLEDLHLDLAQASVKVHPEHLTELVAQLVGNAFKFSCAGSVVKVSFAAVGDDALLIVSDQGRGMSSAQVRLLALRREFARDPLRRSSSGIGVALVRQIARLYGGDIRIDSDPGNGTRITVHLPGACASPGRS